MSRNWVLQMRNFTHSSRSWHRSGISEFSTHGHNASLHPMQSKSLTRQLNSSRFSQHTRPITIRAPNRHRALNRTTNNYLNSPKTQPPLRNWPRRSHMNLFRHIFRRRQLSHSPQTCVTPCLSSRARSSTEEVTPRNSLVSNRWRKMRSGNH